MKRNILILIAAIILFPLISSCQSVSDINTEIDTPTLDPALEIKLREDYLKYMIDIYGEAEEWSNLDDVWVQCYFGNYSSCEVVYMGDRMHYSQMIREIEIAGYTFIFESGKDIHIYNDSQFYILKEAYDTKLITQNDVYNIGIQSNSRFAERNPKHNHWSC